MPDSPYPDTNDDTSSSPGPRSTTGAPRWVKVLGLAALALLMLVVVLMLFGGGDHGPGRHMGSAGALDGGQLAAAGAISRRIGGHRSASGGHAR